MGICHIRTSHNLHCRSTRLILADLCLQHFTQLNLVSGIFNHNLVPTCTKVWLFEIQWKQLYLSKPQRSKERNFDSKTSSLLHENHRRILLWNRQFSPYQYLHPLHYLLANTRLPNSRPKRYPPQLHRHLLLISLPRWNRPQNLRKQLQISLWQIQPFRRDHRVRVIFTRARRPRLQRSRGPQASPSGRHHDQKNHRQPRQAQAPEQRSRPLEISAVNSTAVVWGKRDLRISEERL